MPPLHNPPELDKRAPLTLRAANSTDRSETVAARCVEIPPSSEEGGGAPEWVMILPAGPDIEGRDGRKWRLDSAAAVAAASLDGAREVPIDWEHAGNIRAPRGEDAPAAGWFTQGPSPRLRGKQKLSAALSKRNGAIPAPAGETSRASRLRCRR